MAPSPEPTLTIESPSTTTTASRMTGSPGFTSEPKRSAVTEGVWACSGDARTAARTSAPTRTRAGELCMGRLRTGKPRREEAKLRPGLDEVEGEPDLGARRLDSRTR